MPRDLPGMYWDPEKNRYFPLASGSVRQTMSRPSLQVSNTPPVPSQTLKRVLEPNPYRTAPSSSPWGTTEVLDDDSFPGKRKKKVHESKSHMWNSMARMQSPAKFSDISRLNHDLLCTSIASTSNSIADDVDTATYNCLSSFAVKKQHNSGYSALIGDQTGWLYSYTTELPHLRTRELFLGADVLSVCYSDEFKIAVPFGPSCEFAIQSLAPGYLDVWSISRIMNKNCYDVRAAHLEGHSLLLGAAGRGVLLPDINTIAGTHGTNCELLRTDSDVLAVYQRNRFAYAGCRNGAIFCFDKRLGSRTINGQAMFGGKSSGSDLSISNKSVTHLSVVREWELLVSTIRGDLEMYDLRFARTPTPVMRFEGHVNSYRQKLGIAVSPCQSILFAAGSDHRIRAWSLRSGDPIDPPSSSPIPESHAPLHNPSHRPHPSLFNDAFPGDIMELQVTGDTGGEKEKGLCLWVASGCTVYRYWLGMQGLE
ncbi:hypothetical protein BXZ70DRAFT_632312 [Cristinia sonorae]|uniref:WD40 repeat-like protein n=1 Tax=Cristinia sonorae TaxID=1940300 RepID=A0A8K0UGR0_9AGAR|nr:hypothetical protein BXZ70DRAFT_632312 [Cristinia sonorae]